MSARTHARGAERGVQPERLDVKSARVTTNSHEELHRGFQQLPDANATNAATSVARSAAIATDMSSGDFPTRGRT